MTVLRRKCVSQLFPVKPVVKPHQTGTLLLESVVCTLSSYMAGLLVSVKASHVR